MTVHTILTRKGSTVYAIQPTASIAYAAKSLAEHGIGALVVAGAEGRTVGIISERDIVRALSARGSAVLHTPVAEIMTRKVMTCTRQEKLADLMQRMTEGKFRHLPVIEEGRVRRHRVDRRRGQVAARGTGAGIKRTARVHPLGMIRLPSVL